MPRLHNHHLKPFSQKLRRDMTKEERHLWYDFLQDLPLTVHRQMVIGKYIVDFCIPELHIVIELDGYQHGDPENVLADRKRDEWLVSQGYSVLRYDNREINKQFEFVCQDIWFHLFPDGESE